MGTRREMKMTNINERVRKVVQAVLTYLHFAGAKKTAERLGHALQRITLNPNRRGWRDGINGIRKGADSFFRDETTFPQPRCARCGIGGVMAPNKVYDTQKKAWMHKVCPAVCVEFPM